MCERPVSIYRSGWKTCMKISVQPKKKLLKLRNMIV